MPMIAQRVTFVDVGDAEVGNENVSLKFYSSEIANLQSQATTGTVWSATFTVGNEIANTRNVSMVVKKDGVAVTVPTVILSWVSSSAGGAPITIDTIMTVGPGRVLSDLTSSNSKPLYPLLTDANGNVVIGIESENSETVYLNLAMPDGSVVSSSGIVFS